QCDLCNKGWSIFRLQGLFTYCLPDGSYAWIDRDFRWCNGCEGFSAVERLPDEHELTLSLENAKNEHNKKHIRENEAAIEWRKLRMSPPKCLYCGSSDILETDPVKHPGCGGKIQKIK